ncbi:MAG: hypothetical protein JWM98_340, partial [Thermoleophilia bacterium]|nr:hypothetical protein [Thermoleophilia bacterium]
MTDGAHLVATVGGLVAAAGALLRLSTRARVHALGLPAMLAGWLAVVVAVAPSSVRDHLAPALA